MTEKTNKFTAAKMKIKHIFNGIIKPDGVHSLKQRIEREQLKTKIDSNSREYL